MGKDSKNNPLGLLAFGAILISAAISVILLLNKFAGLNIPTGVLQTVSTIFLLIVVYVTAWSYARTLHTFWKIIYWVMLILTIAGIVVIYI